MPTTLDPQATREAFRASDARDWKAGKDAEIDNIRRLNAFKEVPRSNGKNIITPKWVLCRSSDHFIANNKQLVYKTSLIYERQVDGSLSSLLTHNKLRRLRGQGAPRQGRSEAPSGFKTVTPVTRFGSIYELNCGMFALGNALFDSSTKHDFVRFPSAR